MPRQRADAGGASAAGRPAGLLDFAAPELQRQLDALRNQVLQALRPPPSSPPQLGQSRIGPAMSRDQLDVRVQLAFEDLSFGTEPGTCLCKSRCKSIAVIT